MVEVSIVIRCKNEEKFIGQTLEKVYSQKTDIPFEVIVVDSGSTDQTLAIVGAYNQIRVFCIPPESFTFGYALNCGIENSNGAIICNLSAHCIPTDDRWLEEMIDPIVKSRAHATFGRQVAIRGINRWEEIALDEAFPEHCEIKGRLPFSNANCAFLKSMWVEREFDEEVSSWEDYLWYFFMKDKYAFQYCPKGAVYHTHPFSIQSVSRRAYIDGKAFKFIKNKYGVDFLNCECPTLKTKVKILYNDIKHHVKLFIKAGHVQYIFPMPVVRFFAYKAFWKGYESIKSSAEVMPSGNPQHNIIIT